MQPVSGRLRTLAEDWWQVKKKAFARRHALIFSRGKACSTALGPEPADCGEDERIIRGIVGIGVLDTAHGHYVSTLLMLVPLVFIVPHAEGIPGFVLATILSLMGAFFLGITKARARAYQVASTWIAFQNSAKFRALFPLRAVERLVALHDGHSKRSALSFVLTAIILAYLSSKDGMLVASAQLAGAALAVYGVSTRAASMTAQRLRDIIDAASWRSVPCIEQVGALAEQDFQYWSEPHNREYVIRKGKFHIIWEAYIIVLSVMLFAIGANTIFPYYYIFAVIWIGLLWGSGLMLASSDTGGGLFCRRPASGRLGRALSWVLSIQLS